MVRIIPKDTTTITVPKSLQVPHRCLLSNLKVVQHLYDSKHMPHDRFDNWFAKNSETYQLGNSELCMKLWDEVATYKRTVKEYDVDKLKDLLANSKIYNFSVCAKHNVPRIRINWSQIKNKNDNRLADEIWKYSSPADENKSSVSVSDLIWHISQHSWAIELITPWLAYFSPQLSNVTIAALLIHAFGNPVARCNLRIMSKYSYCCLSSTDYQGVFKSLSTALRRTGHWENGKRATLAEVTGCASWELAIGRSGNLSNWVKEKEERTQTLIHLAMPDQLPRNENTTKQYCAKLSEHLDGIFNELVKPPTKQESWVEYVENRQSWCSSGSTGGKKLRLPDGSQVRMNKHAYFETLTTDEMVAWLTTEPRVDAVASEKFEMGKSRSIYGTTTIEYVISSYVLDGIEPHLSNVDGLEAGLVGLDFLATMIRRVHASSKDNAECTMIDFANFNLQHPLEAQSLVFSRLAAALKRRGYHDDKVVASTWVADGLKNQWCKFPQDHGQSVQIVQGMFSGCRGTNAINTILNLAYFRVSQEWVKENFDLMPVNLHNIHQGDDVWITNESRLWAVAMYECMQASGFIFQPSKQMFDRSRGEFLRVVYTKDGCMGYLARAIGTTIVKPIQNTDVVGPAERAIALNDQIMILRRRGLSLAGSELLWNAIVPYAARSKLPNGALTIPVSYLKKSYLDGGLDLGPPETAAARSDRVARIPSLTLGSKVLESALPTNMAEAWANRLSRKLKQPIKYDSIVQSLHRANVTDSLRNEDRTLCLRGLEKDLRTWLSKLSTGVVKRDRQTYEALLAGEYGQKTFIDMLKILGRNELLKKTSGQHGPVDCVHQAVGASPFKSVNNAMVATGLGEADALILALSLCPNVTLMNQALTLVTALKTNCSESIMLAVVSGLAAGATKYQCEFHPIVLSWVQTWSMKAALTRILNGNVMDRPTAELIVSEEMDKHVRSARLDGTLLALSRC